MKNILLSLLLLPFALCGCAANQAHDLPILASAWFNGTGDIRTNTNVFVGHVSGKASAQLVVLTMDREVVLDDGKRRVINRALKFEEDYELGATIPWWCLPLFPNAQLEPGGPRMVAALSTGEIVFIEATP